MSDKEFNYLGMNASEDHRYKYIDK